MQKTILFLLPVILVAACVGSSGTGLVGTSVVEEKAAPAPVEDKTLPIGLTLAVGDSASTYSYDVIVTSAQITKSYATGSGTVTAPAGKKFILIDAKIDQKADMAVNIGRSNFFATDKGMITQYPSSYAGNDGLVGLTILAPGESISGKAAFEVPENIQGPIVVYNFGAEITVTNMVGWIIS